jgi:hypothetical protein
LRCGFVRAAVVRTKEGYAVDLAGDSGLADDAINHPIRIALDLRSGPPDHHEPRFFQSELASLLLDQRRSGGP